MAEALPDGDPSVARVSDRQLGLMSSFNLHSPANEARLALLQSTGLSRAAEDTSAVQDFMMSRDAVRKLEQKDDLRTVFSRPEGDFVSLVRLAGRLASKLARERT